MDKKIKIGLIGLGTVGSGVFKTLTSFDNIEVKAIAVRNINKKRDIEGLDNSIITDDAYKIVNDPEIDIVAELVGGLEPAFDLIATAIRNGKEVELGIEEINLVFQIIEEKNGLFSKKATIQVYELSDAIEYANQYIKDVIQSLGISDVEAKSSLEDDV